MNNSALWWKRVSEWPCLSWVNCNKELKWDPETRWHFSFFLPIQIRFIIKGETVLYHIPFQETAGVGSSIYCMSQAGNCDWLIIKCYFSEVTQRHNKLLPDSWFVLNAAAKQSSNFLFSSCCPFYQNIVAFYNHHIENELFFYWEKQMNLSKPLKY